MHNQNDQNLKDAIWRGRLRPADEARLREFIRLEAGAEVQLREELALTRCLNHLPNASVSSNFTARVMQAARQTPVQRSMWEQFFSWRLWSTRWMPRLAVCALTVFAGVVSFQGHQIILREKMARDLGQVSGLATLPPVDWMKNFDTINSLNKVKVVDEDLLAVLQ